MRVYDMKHIMYARKYGFKCSKFALFTATLVFMT